METLKEGNAAPDFELLNQNGNTVKLSDYKGKVNVVLFFYPKDFSPGCTAEACAFRDNYDVFKEKGAEVIGISADPEDTHADFIKKHGLQFELLADPKGETAEKYGIKRIMFGFLPGRVTFVMDRQGIIRKIFSSNTNMEAHVKEALKIISELKA
jgi:peroxiredoxin Q/BCP